MAQVQLAPATLNASMTQGQVQFFQSTVVNSLAGTPVDLSAWVSLTAKAVANTPGPCTADVTFGTVTGANTGVITLQTSVSDLSSASPGSAQLVITGKPTSGDSTQIIARGSLTVNAG